MSFSYTVTPKKSTLYKIFSNAGLIAILTLLVKLVAMAKEMLVAQQFGVGNELDSFLMAYLLPQLLINVVAGSFATSFIPVFSGVIVNKEMSAARLVLQESSLILTLLLLLTVAVFYLLLPLVLPIIASGFSAEKLQQTQLLSYWLLPVILLNGLSIFYAGVLNVKHYYSMPAMLPVLTPLAIIAVLIIYTDLGINALAMGTLMGALLEVMILIGVLKKEGWYILPKWQGYLEETKHLLQQYKPMIVGALIMSGTGVVDQSMAAMSGMPAGSVAALSYGNKVIALCLGLGATAVGAAVFSHFSEMVAENKWQEINYVLANTLKAIMLITIPIVIGIIFFSEELVSMLYQRGKFSIEDTRIVAQVQLFYGLQVPFYLMGIVGVRLLSAMRRNDVLMKIAIVSLAINVAANWLFMQWFGVAGIALSTALVVTISTTSILLIIHKKYEINHSF